MQSSYAFCMATVGFTEWSSKGLFPTKESSWMKCTFYFQTFFKEHMGVWFIHGAKFWRLQLSGKIVPDFQSVLDCQAKQKLRACNLYMPTFVQYTSKIRAKAHHLTTQFTLLFIAVQLWVAAATSWYWQSTQGTLLGHLHKRQATQGARQK